MRVIGVKQGVEIEGRLMDAAAAGKLRVHELVIIKYDRQTE